MVQKESAKNIRLRRSERASEERLSYAQRQELYCESIGVFKGNKVRRDERYESDIKYIQGISLDTVLSEWKDKILLVLEQHNDVNVTKNARHKTKIIKIIYDFNKQKETHNNALEKMLNALA